VVAAIGVVPFNLAAANLLMNAIDRRTNEK
jgi:hypothetical protein